MSGSLITEGRFAGGFIVSEQGQISRDLSTIRNTTAAAVSLSAGLVLAQRSIGTITAAKASGTGDGVVTAPTLGARTQIGTYVLTCTAAAANAGTFSVFAPDGTRLADLTVGVAYTNSHLTALTVADGATDWGVGAVVNVVVPAGDLSWVPFTNAAGLPAAGVLFARADIAASSTVAGTIFARDGEVNFAELIWDSSLTGTPLATAQAAARITLAQSQIICR
jgi:hypothetical protein